MFCVTLTQSQGDLGQIMYFLLNASTFKPLDIEDTI